MADSVSTMSPSKSKTSARIISQEEEGDEQKETKVRKKKRVGATAGVVLPLTPARRSGHFGGSPASGGFSSSAGLPRNSASDSFISSPGATCFSAAAVFLARSGLPASCHFMARL